MLRIGVPVASLVLCACGATVQRGPPASPLRLSSENIERIAVNGVELALLDVCPQSSRRPVMLFIHGGPGASEMSLVHRYAREACGFARLIVWDQRGAGRSFSERSIDTLSTETLVRDGLEVTRWVLARTGARKVLLVGNSWGSYLGLRMFSSEPTRYYGYIGISQLVTMDWDAAGTCVRELGQPWGYEGTPATAGEVMARMRTIAQAGGSIYGAHDFRPIQAMREGSPIALLPSERAGRDQAQSISQLLPELIAIDLRKSIPRPPGNMAFIAGEVDCVTPARVVEGYARQLGVPLVRVERAGHLPHAERPRETFVEVARLSRAWCN